MKPVIALLACVAGTPAFADCVTAADLKGGIRATAEDGQFEDFRTIDTNLVEMIIDFGDGTVAHNHLAHGVYVVDVFDKEGGRILKETRVVTTHEMATADMPLPAPNAQWVATASLRDADGVFAEQQTHSWQSETTITLEGCTYAAIPGVIRYQTDFDWFEEEITYLPQVGISLQSAYTDEVDGRYEFSPYVSLSAIRN